MIREILRPSFPDWWGEIEPPSDPRLKALEQVEHAVRDAVDVAWGSIVYDREHPDPGLDPILPPLGLAAMLREVAQDIEDFTAQA